MIGILLLNLGTPNSAHHKDVKSYLAEFLMDPLVVDIPWIARAALVYGIILPLRPKKSAEAYQKIWTDRGSPLLFHLVDLGKKVSERLARVGTEFHVEVAMRYGKPTIESALQKLQARGAREIRVLPMYPQFSLAATQSSVDKTKALARHLGIQDKLKFLPAFYRDELFISAFNKVAKESLSEFEYDYILFSFHGLPERQIKRAEREPRNHCLASSNCCEAISDVNRDCYRAQSFATAHAIAQSLGIPRSEFKKKYGVSFQSRLGRTPWIKPYTDLAFADLVRSGVKRVAVVCPSFVADCLETLEEIEIRGKESFIGLGGEALKLVPSLNSSEPWVEAVAKMVTQ